MAGSPIPAGRMAGPGESYDPVRERDARYPITAPPSTLMVWPVM